MSHHHGAANAHRTIAGLYGLLTLVVALVLYGTVDDGKWWVLLISVVFLVPVGLHLGIAYGADRCQPWARVASIVVGVLMLTGFPIGTALGVWLLVNACPVWVQECRYSGSLADGWPQAPAQPPPLPPQDGLHAPARAPEIVA